MRWQKLKKQVAKTSTKKPFRNFKKPESKLANAISNVESDLDNNKDEDTILSLEETEEEEVVECHGMWDFILPNSDIENEQEDFPVSTRSKGTTEPIQPTQKKKNMGPTGKDKVP